MQKKMMKCKQEQQELAANYRKHKETIEVQRNKEELVYTTTANGANFKATTDMRTKLLGEQETLYQQDDQLSNIRAMAENTIDTNNATNQAMRQQRDLIQNINEKNMYVNSKVGETGSVVNQMTRKEYILKCYIFIAVILMFFADVAVLLFVTLGISI